MARGRLIAFEGIDGSGKSTALRSVHAALLTSGRELVRTREETDSWRGEAVRRSITDRNSPWTTLHLFLADRAQHVRDLEPALAGGAHVLTDRFMHSTLAYQSVSLAQEVADPVPMLRGLHEPWCPKPDHVVLFDLAPDVAVARADARGATTPYEKIEFLTKVRETYLDLAAQDGFAVIDASQSPEAVAAAAMAQVSRWLD